MVGKVHGPIQWIDIPDAIVLPFDLTAFLGKDMSAGKTLVDLGKQISLGGMVRLGDQVDHTLVLDVMFLAIAFAKDRSGGTSQAFDFCQSGRCHFTFQMRRPSAERAKSTASM